MNASIIVLTYNSQEYIKECLDSIIKNKDSNDQVIVIDNNSTDNTRNILKKYKNIDIYFCDRNIGISEGRNLGVELSKYDLLFFIDSDMILSENSIKSAKKTYKKYDAKAIIGFYEEIGSGYNWFNEMEREFFSIKERNNIDNIITFKNFACFSGGLCLINKKIFKKYNGYDSNFNFYPSEDINLELMMLRDKKMIVFEKGFSGTHYKGYLSFKNLIKKYCKSGMAVSKLIKSSFHYGYKIPFNNRWPCLPIFPLLEILILIISIFYNYLFILLFLVVLYRILPIIIHNRRGFIKNTKFIILRFFIELVMFVNMIKSLFLHDFKEKKKMEYTFTKYEV